MKEVLIFNNCSLRATIWGLIKIKKFIGIYRITTQKNFFLKFLFFQGIDYWATNGNWISIRKLMTYELWFPKLKMKCNFLPEKDLPLEIHTGNTYLQCLRLLWPPIELLEPPILNHFGPQIIWARSTGFGNFIVTAAVNCRRYLKIEIHL